MAYANLPKPSASPAARLQHRSRLPRFLIGQDRRGNWVVQDRAGLCGGLFVNRSEALRFAMREYDGGSQATVMVAGPLELTVGPAPVHLASRRPRPRRRLAGREPLGPWAH